MIIMSFESGPETLRDLRPFSLPGGTRGGFPLNGSCKVSSSGHSSLRPDEK